ncbi:MAG TPA: VC0807 family protein [Ktedonobacteraceae bacterium]|nr:VC0807 family protein [Ktedonobacteraceae bacterium]
MSSTPSTAQAPSFRSTIRGILPSIIVNGVLPYIIYQILKSQTSFSDLTILFISAVPAIIGGIVSIIRNRNLDFIAGITLVGIAVTIIAALIGGDPRLFLIRESFLTVALGIVCLVSLLFPKPVWFYLIRYFAGGNNPERIAEFNNSWQYPGFRSFTRVLTLVWGLTYLGEFILRVILVYNMSIAQFLAISPFIFYGITFAVIAFTIAYGRRARRQGEERRKRLAETQASAVAEVEQA